MVVMIYTHSLPYPKVVSSVYIPLDEIALSFWCKRVEAVIVGDATALLVRLLLVLLVMAMVGVEDVGKLSSLVFCVHNLDHGLLQLGAGELALYLFNLLAGPVVEGMEQLLLEATLPRA